MKITGIKTFLVSAEERSAGLSTRPRGRNWLFVKVYTDAGVTGIGEGGGWPVVVAKAIDELAWFLIGEDPFASTRLWFKLYDILHGHGVTGAVRGGAISAIDIALWDIKGKVLGVPVYQLLGGKLRDTIDVYGPRRFGGDGSGAGGARLPRLQVPALRNPAGRVAKCGRHRGRDRRPLPRGAHPGGGDSARPRLRAVPSHVL